ncbi:hypothetical protein FB645_002341 [Coemansia sp. IMI 203386]|nr:hypothetical protein FB645_002341 [Coemansia sp. IMI 203386]
MDDYLASSQELNDADKRAFLYSDLSIQKTENPESYTEALGFWKTLLMDVSTKGLVTTKTSPSRLCIDHKQLSALFLYKGDTPMGLDTVVDELVQKGEFQPIDEYFAWSVRRLVGWIAYKVPFINRKLRSLVYGNGYGIDGRLVVCSAVQRAGQRVLDSHYEQVACSLMDNLMDMEEFRLKFADALSPSISANKVSQESQKNDEKKKGQGTMMSLVDADILIKHLLDLGHLTTMQLDHRHQLGDNRTLIKFAASIRTRVQPITEADTGAFQVIWTLKQLERQVDQLETRVCVLDTQIRQALKTSNGKKMALSRLRLKRHIELDVLPKRIDALHNIERVCMRLEQTSSEIQLMEAFEAGTRALKGLNDSVQVDRIGRVFDDWAEESLRASDLDDVMADGRAGVQVAAGLSGEDADDELEAELEALLEEERKKDLKELASNSASRVDAMPEPDDASKLADILQNVSLAADTDAQTPRDHKQDDSEKVAVPAE